MNLRRTLAGLGVAAIMLVPAAPAIAQYTGTTPPEVLPSDTTRPQVEGSRHTRGTAVTGADVAGLIGLGGVAVVGGVVIRRAGRGRKRA